MTSPVESSRYRPGAGSPCSSAGRRRVTPGVLTLDESSASAKSPLHERPDVVAMNQRELRSGHDPTAKFLLCGHDTGIRSPAPHPADPEATQSVLAVADRRTTAGKPQRPTRRLQRRGARARLGRGPTVAKGRRSRRFAFRRCRQTDLMKIKNRDSGADVPRAELILEGRQDVERLRRALDSYSRFVTDDEAAFAIPIPVPGDVPGET